MPSEPFRVLHGSSPSRLCRALPGSRFCALLVCLCLLLAGPLHANSGSQEELVARYESLLLFSPDDYEISEAAKAAFENGLRGRFRRAVRLAGSFSYERRGEVAYFLSDLGGANETDAERRAREAANGEFHNLFNQVLPTLALAYHTPSTSDWRNPYYQNASVLQLCLAILDYSYSRGLTEDAWLPDHAGNASADALAQGLVRTAGDFSEISLRLGGYIQTVFLMREALAEAGLLAKYRAVVRNLAVNHGTMYGAFFQVARQEAGVSYPAPLPVERQYHLNADGVRLFADYFWPYYLLIDNGIERTSAATVLGKVIETNIAIKPGVYGTIKPDGTGFHHATAYVGAYSPFAFEAFAPLALPPQGNDVLPHRERRSPQAGAGQLSGDGPEIRSVRCAPRTPHSRERGRQIGRDLKGHGIHGSSGRNG